MVRKVVKKNTHFVFFILAAVLLILAVPVKATDTFATQVVGSYSCQFTAEEALVEYCGVNGSVDIDTGASGYTDDFLMNAGGDFSGTHDAKAYTLSRNVALNGGGSVDAFSQEKGSPFNTWVKVEITATTLDMSQDISFTDLGLAPYVNIGFAVNAQYAWVRFSFDASAAQAQQLANQFGLSQAQATSLYQGGVLGLIGELSQFGYSGTDVVNLALAKGIAYLEELLGKLSGGYVPGPIDKAVSKYNIPWGPAKSLYSEFGETAFVEALARSSDYKTFVANLKGWDVAVWAGSVFDKTEVASGELIHAAFRLFHPDTGEQFLNSHMVPYANIVQVLPDGEIDGLGGYFGYVEFTLDKETGTYRAVINTAPDENNRLQAGEYRAFIVLRNPGNDLYSTLKANFWVT